MPHAELISALSSPQLPVAGDMWLIELGGDGVSSEASCELHFSVLICWKLQKFSVNVWIKNCSRW